LEEIKDGGGGVGKGEGRVVEVRVEASMGTVAFPGYSSRRARSSRSRGSGVEEG
jgi:hypothetical protein